MATKDNEKRKNQEIASRLARFRSEKFVLEGISNGNHVSVNEARRMAGRNQRKISELKSTPSYPQ